MNIKWNWVKLLQIANFYILKEQMLKSSQLSHQIYATETEEFKTYKPLQTAALASLILQAASDMSQYLVASSKSSGGKIDISLV